MSHVDIKIRTYFRNVFFIVKYFEMTSFLEALNILLCVIESQVVIINKIFEV